MEKTSLPQYVRDLMTVGVTTCAPDTHVTDLAALFLEQNLEEIIVLEEGKSLGVVGQDELVRVIAEKEEWETLVAEDIMREDYMEAPADLPLVAVIQLMRDQKARAVFLMHHSSGIRYPSGILTYRHLLRLLAAKTPEDLADLGFNAARQSPLDAFRQRLEAAQQKRRPASSS